MQEMITLTFWPRRCDGGHNITYFMIILVVNPSLLTLEAVQAIHGRRYVACDLEL